MLCFVLGCLFFSSNHYNFLDFFFPLSHRQIVREKQGLNGFLLPDMLSNLVWLFLLKHASILHGSNN